MKKTANRTSIISGLLVGLFLSVLSPAVFGKGKPPPPPPSEPPNPVIAVFEGGDIDVMNSDGSNRFEVVHGITSRFGAGPTPAWSPDGTQIAAFGTERILRVLNIDGTEPTPVQPLPTWIGWWDTYPVAWGDGGIVFANNETETQQVTDLYLVQPNGTGLVVNLTNSHNRGEFNPSWLPDGETLAFIAFEVNNFGTHDLILLNVSTMEETSLRELLSNDGVLDRLEYVDWANTKNSFAFSLDGSIWVVDLDGNLSPLSPLPRLVAAPSGGRFETPSWSADDTELVFCGKDSSNGKDGVYKAPSDGTGSPARIGGGNRAYWWGNAE